MLYSIEMVRKRLNVTYRNEQKYFKHLNKYKLKGNCFNILLFLFFPHFKLQQTASFLHVKAHPKGLC